VNPDPVRRAPEIKFCGLTRPEDAEVAVDLAADYTGVIFAGGPRMLTLERAMEVLSVVPISRRVGVFGDQSVDEITKAADWAQLQVIQLHGATTRERIDAIRSDFSGEIWAVCRVAGAALPPSVDEAFTLANRVLLDAYVPGALGGTGVAIPWADIAGQVEGVRTRRRKPLILAGGLRPENVAAAIAAIAPEVVDVSSGVECAPGIKDHARMRAFRDAVRASIPT
jgi:phosphoribosylanthranilate isomerase